MREQVLMAVVAIALLIYATLALPWANRTILPVIWGGTVIVGDKGCPAGMPGIEIGFRSDGMVIWRRAEK